MLKEHGRVFVNLLFLADMGAIAASWVAAYYIRFHTGVIPVYSGVPVLSNYLWLLVVIIIIWAAAFRGYGLYRQRRLSSRMHEARDIAGASVIGILVLVAVTYFARQYEFSRLVFLLFFFISVLTVTTARWCARAGLRYARMSGRNLRYAIVVGTGAPAEGIITRIEEHPEAGVKLLGVVAPDMDRTLLRVAGANVIGGFGAIRDIIRAHGVDLVFVALTWNEHSRVVEVLKAVGDEAVDIKVIPDLYEFMTLGGGVEDFDGVPILNIQNSPVYGWNGIIKRAADILISSAAIVAASPLMMVIAVVIRLTSGGPVLYRQERMSIGGDRFEILKFRSMKPGAEDETGAVWSREGDSRRTWFGAVLRRTSLDELPQLVNVLRGEMSLVGPRPERPVFIREFRARLPGYMLRHKMKAGMTGWAQVNGWRGNTDITKRLECDLYYIRNWSIALDLKILCLTVLRGLNNRNAY